MRSLGMDSMADIFIPPEGAMQFHVTFDLYTNTDVSAKGFTVWVGRDMAEIKRGAAGSSLCSCTRVYKVIPQPSAPKGDYFVCGCEGRIIE